MRKVRKAAVAALVTSAAAATMATGTSTPASAAAGTLAGAASGCWLLSGASASIVPPSGPITAGSKVHVSATVCNVLKVRLQITGPGLDQRVDDGSSTMGVSGTLEGDVTVPRSGRFTLSVIGDVTGHVYDTENFSVTASSSPTPNRAHKTPESRRKTGGSGAGSKVPKGSGGAGAPGDVGGVPTIMPPGGASPFTLPSVAPDGSFTGFRYPTPEPQVAAPPARQPAARDTAATTPVKWGQSIAVALVLLLLSAHFGMWSRRQRIAAEARAANGGSGGATGARRDATAHDSAERSRPAGSRSGGAASAATDGGEQSRRGSGRHGYRGRRRRD